MKPKLLILLLSLFIVSGIYAQQGNKKVAWLPYEHYFDPLILDPVECQSFGSLFAFWEGSKLQEIIFSPLGLGFQLPVAQWDKGDHGFEVGFMTTIFFQFEFVQPTSLFQVNLMNTDFKVGIPFIFRKKKFSLRTAIFHVSSHFSEEYIFRHGIDNFGNNMNTYDAVDIHSSWKFDKMRYYGGVGCAFNSPHNRGIWKFQGGIEYRSPVKHGSKFNYFAGIDLQMQQETEWSLNTMVGAGIELVMRPGRTFQLLAQYFTGNIPYTQYTHLKVQYLGATLIGHPF